MTKQNYSPRIDGKDRKDGKTGEAGKAGKARKAGRPATGRSTQIFSISVPIQLVSDVRKAAFDNGESYSGFVARAMQAALLRIQSTKRRRKPAPKVKQTATLPLTSTSISTPAPKPLPSAAREDDPCHHLRREPNGNWHLFLTVDRGRESTAQPIDLCLRTNSEELAREHRDVILVAIEKARSVVAAVA